MFPVGDVQTCLNDMLMAALTSNAVQKPSQVSAVSTIRAHDVCLTIARCHANRIKGIRFGTCAESFIRENIIRA